MDRIDIHEDLCAELHKLYVAKNSDYGDSFAKVREEIPNAILVRLSDKMNRLKSLMTKDDDDRKVRDESIDDTLIDIANYALLELVERRYEGDYYDDEEDDDDDEPSMSFTESIGDLIKNFSGVSHVLSHNLWLNDSNHVEYFLKKNDDKAITVDMFTVKDGKYSRERVGRLTPNTKWLEINLEKIFSEEGTVAKEPKNYFFKKDNNSVRTEIEAIWITIRKTYKVTTKVYVNDELISEDFKFYNKEYFEKIFTKEINNVNASKD